MKGKQTATRPLRLFKQLTDRAAVGAPNKCEGYEKREKDITTTEACSSANRQAGRLTINMVHGRNKHRHVMRSQWLRHKTRQKREEEHVCCVTCYGFVGWRG